MTTAFAVPSQHADRYRAQMLAARAPDPPADVTETPSDVQPSRVTRSNGSAGRVQPDGAPRAGNGVVGVHGVRRGALPVTPRLAADIRFVTWAVARFRTFLQERWKSAYKWGRRYMLARTFAISHAGGPATKAVAAKRNEICGACPHRIVRGGRAFCQSCGCGYHRLATLPRKNRLAWYKCPRGRFDATKGFLQSCLTKLRK